MISGVYWAVGKRAHNGDSLALEEVHTDRGECTLMAVADGVGSLEHDETASGFVVECMVRWFYECGLRCGILSRGKIKRSLRRAALDCHMAMKKYASDGGFKWASTCTLVCIWKNTYMCMQIGDSVCLKVCPKVRLKGCLKADNKRIRTIGKRERNENGQLTGCLGCGQFSEPDIVFGRIRPGEALLAATDGFADSFGAEELGNMLRLNGDLSRERIEKRLRSIGEEAEKRGAEDNRSAVFTVITGGFAGK